ncbi:hypothetical protein BU15DRAFT_73743 [Melanogaster broomeanus]|nr:hypothetical protein BU15DRAFT_73743 [Melanogaster broomeanus]
MSTTTAASRATPPLSRRSLQSTSTSPPSAPVTRTATSARSALATPRASGSPLNSGGVSRRASIKGGPGSLGSAPESREALSASLKHETEQKEHLLVQLQNKDQTIVTLTSENDSILSSLNAAETRLNELYAEQARVEEEMAARIEVAEKLRAQVRELEKEKRDVQRRYNEQTSTFEAERQAFYDNEQHLKSRIQSLTQARKQSEPIRTVESEPEVVADETDFPSEPPEPVPVRTQPMDDPASEPAEMTSLRLELSTLSTSYSSLQSTLVLMQTQLVDLKRVNNHLQEENESYMILLREKTLNGQFDLMKQVGGAPSTTSGLDEDEDEDEDGMGDDNDVRSLRSTARSTLDRVDEEAGEEEQEMLDHSNDRHATDSSRRLHGRHTRRNGSASHSPSRASRGESLAGLPITGPGLDLAAELGRAENKDILSGDSIDERSGLNAKGRKNKGSTEARKVSSSEPHDQGLPSSDVEALRIEVKSLRDANKALSLYASKILDRIIAEDAFEHVLAVDYEKSTPTMAETPKTPSRTSSSSAPKEPKPRPQSAIFSRISSNPVITTPTEQPAPVTLHVDSSNSASTKTQRRSLSFDWKGFSMFGGGSEKKAENLRSLTLKPGAPSVTGARKLETFEDDEDRRERERLNATMKLMGIEKPAPSPNLVSSPAAVPMQKSYSSPAGPPMTAAATPSGRFPIFRSRSTTGHSDTSSINSAPSIGTHSPYGLSVSDNGTAELTQEALEQAEAENTLAALDAHERNLSEEIAKGGTGGFTDIAPRRGLGEEWRSRRSRRSGGGSGSTVWSAGMSRAGDDPGA